MVNVENACASASTAFRGVWVEIASGLYDVGLAVGVDTMEHLSRRQRHDRMGLCLGWHTWNMENFRRNHSVK